MSAKVVNCRICGGHVDVVGQLSTRKRCEACGQARLTQALHDLRNHSGEHFESWRAGLLAAMLDLSGGMCSPSTAAEPVSVLRPTESSRSLAA